MRHLYQPLVEAVADRMIEEGIDLVPLDSIERATAAGFFAKTFQDDVEAEVSRRLDLPDLRQYALPLA